MTTSYSVCLWGVWSLNLVWFFWQLILDVSKRWLTFWEHHSSQCSGQSAREVSAPRVACWLFCWWSFGLVACERERSVRSLPVGLFVWVCFGCLLWGFCVGFWGAFWYQTWLTELGFSTPFVNRVCGGVCQPGLKAMLSTRFKRLKVFHDVALRGVFLSYLTPDISYLEEATFRPYGVCFWGDFSDQFFARTYLVLCNQLSHILTTHLLTCNPPVNVCCFLRGAVCKFGATGNQSGVFFDLFRRLFVPIIGLFESFVLRCIACLAKLLSGLCAN